MDPAITAPPYDRLLRVAEDVARERPEVDLELAREIFLEAASLLHNGLALDGLDDHDADAVVDGLCSDLVAPDQGEAIRSRSRRVLEEPGDLHDPESVSRALLIVVSLFKL
ncbi:hypothetical protein [Nocardioides mangrovi]|uniref:DUF222 domain-containing protein n=1 Tax=Nocardioides mangrovi TaxID=2874580 RepID=A0ABS7U8K0_9ACTN|nr:hypothetical protein [Nocardioides mangrovi]MBZ5737162.1 hypothetical protein [Nocardioides mangrovi]